MKTLWQFVKLKEVRMQNYLTILCIHCLALCVCMFLTNVLWPTVALNILVTSILYA